MLKEVSAYIHNYSYILIFALLSICNSTVLRSQSVWTTDQYLSFEAQEEPLPYQESIDFLNHKAKGMPMIDNYEFRTETDEMEFLRQRYQFRMQFNSSDERKAYDKILLANKDKYKWLQSKYELDKWEEKYKNIIDLYFNQLEFEMLKEELILLEDKKTILTKILNNDVNGDISDWISNENDILDLRTDSMELVHRRNEIGQKIFKSDRTVPSIDGTSWIGLADLQKVLDEVLENEQLHPDDGLVVAEEKMANAEYQLELAESKKWLEFAQIQYQSDDDLNFQKELSFGTSIVIPHKNNNRARKNETALDLLEKNYETIKEHEDRKNELLLERARFNDLVQQYEVYKEMREGQQLESMYDSYESEKLVSPLVLIGLRRSVLGQLKKQMNIEKDVYNSYINLLTLKSAFLIDPGRNYLKN